jgi:hypothetical protein
MERLPDITGQQLDAKLGERLKKLTAEIAAVMNTARVGRLLDDTDEKVNELCKAFQKEVYEVATQAKIDAAEAAFSPGGPKDPEAGGKQRAAKR